MRSYKSIIAVGMAVAIASASLITVSAQSQTLKQQLNNDKNYGVSFTYNSNVDFASVRNSYKEKGYTPANIENPIVINACDYSLSDKPVKLLNLSGRNKVVHWEESNSFIEWNINVQQSGIYSFKMEYMADNSGISAITRSLLIDGKSFYNEAEEISFYRIFKDSGKPVVNSIGDEVASDVVQSFDWQWQDFLATDASYDGALQFYMQKGTHKVRMQVVSGSLYLSKIKIFSSQQLPSYKEVEESYKTKGYSDGSDKVYFEAESASNTLYKNSSTMRAINNGDPGCSPFSYGKSLINVFGGTLWQGANSSITYQFDVKTPGLYILSMRTLMNFRDGIPSYRSIEIDGQVPFKELSAYKFKYNKTWHNEVISDESGNPYKVYLDAGKHTLTLSVKQGELSEVTSIMEKDSNLLSELMLKVKMIIGQNPDSNYDYELDKQIPDLLPNLNKIITDMKQCMTDMERICNRKQSKYYQIKSFVSQLQELVDSPIIIPSRVTSVEEIITTYGSWLSEMQAHPLTLDYIQIIPKSSDSKISKSSFGQKFYGSLVNFILSFTKDYNNVSIANDNDSNIKTTISVWVSRGTKWCSTMKQLIDSDFTPKTGIAVNLNVLPAGQLNTGGANALLLSITSGKAPDVATGVSGASIGEFAMRNALVDVSKYDDYKQISSEFKPQHFIPLSYNGGVFGLPETQSFMCMIYRKDILSQLGLCIPNTWQEVYNKIIPVLNQNNMQFYVPLSPDAYSMFLFQSGGKYFYDDLKHTNLDSANAYNAMKEYTELFTLFGVPKTASFYNRFRSGEMPIGIVDYATYMTVKVAASDLKNEMGLALIPGKVTESGDINRSHGSLLAETCMIMQQSKHKDEAWEFLKWWTSSSVQTEYSNRLESLLGIAARWPSANWESFLNLAWNTEEISTISKSFDYVEQVPVVLGGYYITRHITNALNRIIISGTNTRDSLEMAVEDINRELQRRRESIS